MEEEKHKSAKPKKGRPATGLKLQGTEQTFHREYEGQEPKVVEHSGPSSTPLEDDDKTVKLADHKYPPPKRHPTFQKIWVEHIDNITARENFKVGHLHSLEILCDLFVEYGELTKFIQENGRSYKSVGRSGVIWKFYPEVAQIKNVQSQIKDYMKLLGLLLKKDHSIESGGEKSEWEL
ncbi:MAG: P27 family phage terminase small subunit [Bdellovibrionales bacterium]|nr:P27 family phage terminase small subunit [Bdellovibrionales bacterium]